jgi:menaquinone-dependent protoporphyrinogen oxidase
MDKMGGLEGYTGVIVGSLIRGGKWVADALDFLGDHRAELSRIPVAYFTVCATLREDTPENRQIVRDYHDSILKDYPEIHPRSIGMFAGRIDYMQLSPLLQLSAKAAKIPSGDWRNWKQIDEWAKSVLPLLRYPMQ